MAAAGTVRGSLGLTEADPGDRGRATTMDSGVWAACIFCLLSSLPVVSNQLGWRPGSHRVLLGLPGGDPMPFPRTGVSLPSRSHGLETS